MAQVIKTYNPAIETIIHTDDKVENNVGAELAGFKSIHFKLPADSVRKTNSEDLEITINNWEKELQIAHGITLKKAE